MSCKWWHLMWKKIHLELEFLRLEFRHFISHHLFFFLFSTQCLFFLSQIVHRMFVLLQPDRLPLFFFETPDRLPLPLLFFKSTDGLLPLFFFVSGSFASGFMELKSKKLKFHVNKLFHLSSPNSSLWGLSLSPNSSFTDSRC